MGKKINYPSRRNRPVKHMVGGYTRDGVKVASHTRGSGAVTGPRKSKQVGHRTDFESKFREPHAFVVDFKYSEKKDDGESVIVITDNYPDAITEAYEERVDHRIPIELEATDPDIGAALKVMASKVKGTIAWGKPKLIRATKLGAGYAIKATMISAKTARNVGVGVAKAGGVAGKYALKAGGKALRESTNLAAFKIQAAIAEDILKQCWQENKAKQTAARHTLKKRYPDIYDMCDFSRETRKSRRVDSYPRRYRSL